LTENELVNDIGARRSWSLLAKLERQEISDRAKAGLERARAKGMRLGRAPFSSANREKLIMALDAGMSWHAASKTTRIPYTTVRKHARLLGYSPRHGTNPTTREVENPHG
jgi:DNA invertase Pin-like site-specific DNA recombinase